MKKAVVIAICVVGLVLATGVYVADAMRTTELQEEDGSQDLRTCTPGTQGDGDSGTDVTGAATAHLGLCSAIRLTDEGVCGGGYYCIDYHGNQDACHDPGAGCNPCESGCGLAFPVCTSSGACPTGWDCLELVGHDACCRP